MSDMTREEAIDILRSYLMFDKSSMQVDIALNMAIEALQAEDADVYKAHEEEHLKIVNRIKELQYAIAKTQMIVGELVESAEAKPTVIRSRTLMPAKDFKEWAKRIREENPNAIIIPCDAEVVSAEADWIPVSERLPEDKCDVLIQFGWNMAVGCIDGGDWRINSGDAWCTEVAEDDGKPIAWMPLPKPYREDGEA